MGVKQAKRTKIAFFGHFDSTNFGNESTLQAILYNLRRFQPAAEVTCISTGPEATVATHHIEAVPIAEGRWFSGPTVCRWYDPTIGEYLPALRRPNRSGSPFANTGDRQFAPPDKNHDGDGDWVLVLEAG